MAYWFILVTLDLLISMAKSLCCSIASKLIGSQDLSETDQNYHCWSKLPQDLLISIAHRLLSPEDLLAFAGVCNAWRSTAALIKSDHSTPQFLPWLALFEKDSDSGSDSRAAPKFLSLSSRKTYELPNLNPRHFRSRTTSSSQGWIISARSVNTRVNAHQEVKLYNPLSKTRIWYIPKLPLRGDCAIKFVVGSDSSDRFSIVAVHEPAPTGNGRYINISYWREGDLKWTSVKDTTSVSISDAAFLGGKVYAIAEGRSVWVLDAAAERLEAVMRLEIHKSETPYLTPHDRESLYVMGSDGGDDLLVVLGDKQWWGSGNVSTAGFQVYEVNLEEKTFSRVESLGDRALFLGDNSSSFSVRASDYGSVVEGNCVYFTDDFRRLGNRRVRNKDFGVFRLSDGKIDYCFDIVKGRDFFHPPIWVQPRFRP